MVRRYGQQNENNAKSNKSLKNAIKENSINDLSSDNSGDQKHYGD